MVEHTYEVKNQILKVQANLIEAENNINSFFSLSGNTNLLPVSQTQKNVFKEIEALQQLTRDNHSQQLLVKKMREAASKWYQILYVTIKNINDIKHNQLIANTKKGNEMLQQVMYISNQMDHAETDLLQKRRQTKSVLEIAAPLYLGVILFVSCVFQLASFYVIIKAFKKRQIHQKILENKIKELNATNAELEQIAFVVSHDLQEPLRKIRTFSDKLIIKHKNDLHEEGEIIVEKISASSRKMQELLGDLINYTQVTRNEEELKDVDLKVCLDEACKELNEIIKAKHASIKVGALPTINGYYKQLYLLFYNLLDNSLKFSKPGVLPVININSYTELSAEFDSSNTYKKITFSDNGIGFEKEYNKKVFVIFKRFLPVNISVAGKGVGLAICKKVMTNHNGYITAKSETGAGAEFTLYFPDNSDEEL